MAPLRRALALMVSSIKRRSLAAIVLAGCWLNGCSLNAGGNAQPVESGSSAIGAYGTESKTTLAQLRETRSKDAFSNRLAIGPGDVIEVTVPGVPELDKLKLRVSEDDTVSLPLAGVIPVDDMTEEELREALYKRLEKPMKDPQVELFVDEYQSREVAVVGMVQKPGVYSITSRSDTILDMVNRAGGMTAEASSRVLFVPGSSLSNSERAALVKGFAPEKASAVAAPERSDPHGTERQVAVQPDRIAPSSFRRDGVDGSAAGESHLRSLLGGSEPIEVDLESGARESDLAVPVRPGDTIIVPAAGEVMVDGWVQNPGAFRIVPGMTALSAVSAAGGALFSQTAAVLRTNTDGSRGSIAVDLSRVKSGAEPDVPVQAGDVVFVQRSPIGAVPYVFYELFSKFGTGMMLPIP